MGRIRLIHWKPQEAGEHLRILGSSGKTCEYDEDWRPGLLREWKKSPPDAFVIDLSRLPSHGREVATDLRNSPATRHIPIVFVGGQPDKVEAVRALLPDAVYSSLPDLRQKLTEALKNPPKAAVIPRKMMERYGSRSVAEKLGIKPGSKVGALDPPPRFPAILGGLPEGCQIVEEPSEAAVVLCFLHHPETMQACISESRKLARHAKLWFVWQKKASKHHKGITDPLVRSAALDLGLVDYKICSIDQDWTAMLFALRKPG